jgi:hypothetical protein
MTTDEDEHERCKLVGYCNQCETWYNCLSEARNCPTCGGRPSHKIGYQLTTQRSFDAKAKRLTKAQLKKMGMGA